MHFPKTMPISNTILLALAARPACPAISYAQPTPGLPSSELSPRPGARWAASLPELRFPLPSCGHLFTYYTHTHV